MAYLKGRMDQNLQEVGGWFRNPAVAPVEIYL